MKLFLSSTLELLPVVDAVSLIAHHLVNREERPVLVGDGVPNPQKRPAANIPLISKEREWARRIREAMVSGALALYNAEGFRIGFDPRPEKFALVYVKPAGLAQWLVDGYNKDVTLDGVRVEPTPAHHEGEILMRELLVARYERIWPSIGADLQDRSRNGLMAEAGLKHGFYDVQRALQWARARGKVFQEQMPVPVPVNDLPGRVHRVT